eukprot:5761993-Pyramimonas_sp.AAC.1
MHLVCWNFWGGYAWIPIVDLGADLADPMKPRTSAVAIMFPPPGGFGRPACAELCRGKPEAR